MAGAFTLTVVLLATLVLRIGSAPFLSGYPSVVSSALALSGYLLVVMGVAISLVILDVSAHGLTVRWHGHTVHAIVVTARDAP